MKRKLLLSMLAMTLAVFAPLTAMGQLFHHQHDAAATDQAEPSSYKYEVYAGFGYTSLNQVNQSRHGLKGVNLSVTRDWGKHFGLMADGGYYGYSSDNPGDPTVESVLFGPVLRAHLFKSYDGFFRVLLGGEHTGGENARPKVAFAWGVGAGAERKMSQHFAVRASGDAINTSFVAGTPALPADYSTHHRYNARASIGIVYKF